MNYIKYIYTHKGDTDATISSPYFHTYVNIQIYTHMYVCLRT